MYYVTNGFGGQTIIIHKNGDVLISFDENPDNTDYKRYLEWVAEGNEPEPWNN